MYNLSMEVFDRQTFWDDPLNSGHESDNVRQTCDPCFYLNLDSVTKFVIDNLEHYLNRDCSILEIGCGTGRNLVALKRAGFRFLQGVEISELAIETGRAHFPEYKDINVIHSPIEDIIYYLEPVDAIFTQGCLMHIPYEFDWVLDQMRVISGKFIMTIEGETMQPDVHKWKRNYQFYFERDDWKQIEEQNCEEIAGLPATTFKRIFWR